MQCVVSGDVDFDSFGMVPWDASGMHGGGCRFCETFWTMMFQWLIRLSCRPVIMDGLDRTMRMNTDYGHEGIMTTNVDSPRLAVTPGEWYASEMLTMMTTDLRNCRTVGGFPQINSAAANCDAVELDDLIFRRTSFPPDEFSVGRVVCRARWRLYMARPVDWPVSVHSISDWPGHSSDIPTDLYAAVSAQQLSLFAV